MKNLFLSVMMTVVTVTMAVAQKTEGYVKYEIAMSSDNPDMAMGVTMFEGSTMELHFKGDNVRTTINMGSLILMTTVVNGETKEALILMGGMMGQKGAITNTDELSADQPLDDSKVEFVKGKMKIEGYKCKKAIVTTGDGSEVIYWYTTKLKANSVGQSTMNSKIPGVALMYELNNSGMLMTFKAVEVSETVSDDTLFTIAVPEGYEELSYEELVQSGSGE